MATAAIEDLIVLFMRIGIDPKKAQEAASNAKLSSNLRFAIESVNYYSFFI